MSASKTKLIKLSVVMSASKTKLIKLRRNWDKGEEFQKLYRAFLAKRSADGAQSFSFTHQIDKYEFMRAFFDGQTGYACYLRIHLIDRGWYKLWVTGGDPGFGANTWLIRGFVQKEEVYAYSLEPLQGKFG